MDSGNIAWMLMASALVLFMTPGLAFFYGGLVRGKNAINMIMYSFTAMGVVSVVWLLWGYSLAFGGDGSFIGNFDYLGFQNVDPDIGPDGGYNSMTIAVFQMMFAIITPALITGAIAERFKFKTYLIFLVIWITVVYAPIAHWVWGDGGWVLEMGAADFAGGTVVHINAGMAAIAAAWLVGKRRGVDRGVEPHNVPFVILGAGILWFGWFGFNAGSGLAADGVAVNAFLVTNVAAGVAALTWVVLSYLQTGKMSAVGAATGAVAGLVAITPAAGSVGPMGGLAVGFGAGILTYIAVLYRHKFGFDDALEVFAVHGIGGIWGALATAIFAVGGVGVIDGEFELLGDNFVAVVATMGYSFIATLVILKILDLVPGLGLRAEESDESTGLDISHHGERAYVSDGAD
ncbi:MAG TPA: ammonium transporter [Dehalococcoidia bacterium]|nr:ammonia channel protein [Chloroflexota bacterium]MDP5877968.1 ammonium transporter [Dehalococcoidia bacterium]MDP6272868.1 ammonium transporter [Dehalococcoidia bacterium]MDP7160701.1 ammonium transporter [Dehalococcoidia bacterium]MDP7514560.1 ammonium transporter [Dehalococcoidia bacterium]